MEPIDRASNIPPFKFYPFIYTRVYKLENDRRIHRISNIGNIGIHWENRYIGISALPIRIHSALRGAASMHCWNPVINRRAACVALVTYSSSHTPPQYSVWSTSGSSAWWIHASWSTCAMSIALMQAGGWCQYLELWECVALAGQAHCRWGWHRNLINCLPQRQWYADKLVKH